MFEHQDWTPVVFKKEIMTKAKTGIKAISQLQPQYKALLNENTESFQTKMFEKSYTDYVVNKRIEKKLSQKQLAAILNIDVHIIQRLEQGKEAYDHNLKVKLNRALGL